jgi:RNA polymerase subunit RPABC4/transcription elongation factor Spt4
VQTCSKCQEQSPDMATHCANCHSNLSEWSTTAVALKKYQENPRVKYVLIAVSHDSCPACQEAEGSYDKFEAPKVPIEGCSHALGCRCFYQPFLDDIYP